MNQIDQLLIKVIDDILRCSLGDINTKIIYEYLEERHCPLKEVPNNLEEISVELRNILVSSRGQILGSAPIIEKRILKASCIKLGLKFNMENSTSSPDCVQKLKEAHNNGKMASSNHI